MLVLDYGPGLLAVLTVFILLVTIFTVMCRRAVTLEHGFCQPSVHQKGLKEVLPLLLYPPIYLVLWTAIVATHIYDVAVNIRVQERNSMIPWLVYSIATYLKRLFIPLICLLHLSRLCCRNKLGNTFLLKLHHMLFPMNSQIKRISPWLYEGKKLRYRPKNTKVYLREQYSSY